MDVTKYMSAIIVKHMYVFTVINKATTEFFITTKT